MRDERGNGYYIYILDVKCFVLKGNNESGNSAKRERFYIKGKRSRWDNSDTKFLLMQTYKWHGIPATGKTFSTERAGITWNCSD